MDSMISWIFIFLGIMVFSSIVVVIPMMIGHLSKTSKDILEELKKIRKYYE